MSEYDGVFFFVGAVVRSMVASLTEPSSFKIPLSTPPCSSVIGCRSTLSRNPDLVVESR